MGGDTNILGYGLKESDIDKLAAITVEADAINYNIGYIKNITGQSITISDVDIDGFKAVEQTVIVPTYGTYYIGFDLFTKALIALPRNIHRGWVCVAKVYSDGTNITTVSKITPTVYKCRIPRFVKKVLDGKICEIGVMGSSLAESNGTTSWIGMLFDNLSSTDMYRVPCGANYKNIAVGGTPNKYQLAQTGLLNTYKGGNVNTSGYSSLHSIKLGRNGRSQWFVDKDLIIITVLANGGGYRLEAVETILRNLKKMNKEVIVCSDNAQNPNMDYDTLSKANLHIDGTEVARLCDKYGFEFADTSAYMFTEYLRGTTVYQDTIHPNAALPAGRLAIPSCGREVWARAIRSTIPIEANPLLNYDYNYDFNTNDLTGMQPNNVANTGLTIVDNRLVATKINAATVQWGANFIIPPINLGDTITLTATLVSRLNTTNTIQAGLQGGGSGWGSNIVSFAVEGQTVTGTLTATRQLLSGGRIFFFAANDSAPLGANFILEDVVFHVNSTVSTGGSDNKETKYETIPLPNRRVSDTKLIGDAIIILPQDEYNQQGTLGASSKGASSFARQLSPTTLATNDLMSVSAGQRVRLGANGVVSIGMVYCNLTADAPVVVNIYKNNALLSNFTISTFYSRESYHEIISQDTLNKTNNTPNNDTFELEVTSGVLKLSALVLFTSELEYLGLDDIEFKGTWFKDVNGGSSSMIGNATNTAEDYASIKCKDNDSAYFIISSRPNSKNVTLITGSAVSENVNTVGVSHIKAIGGLVSPSTDKHIIKLLEAGTTDGATGGYALHIGGAILVKDR